MECPSAVAILVIDERSVQGDGHLDGIRVLVSIRMGEDQLALPGGKVEGSDAGVRQAASRELEEETGLQFDSEAFVIEHTLHRRDWLITLLSVVCPEELLPNVRNLEPEKHGPWTWRTWGDLKKEPSEKIFAPLREMLKDVTTITGGVKT